MDLAALVRSIVRDDDSALVGTVSVTVHPDYTYHLDTDTLHRERRAFTQHLARIPHIDGGLSWKLIAPYTGGNGSLAMATIAIGHALGLWPIIPDPTVSPGLYKTRGSLLPQSGVISRWPEWSGVTVKGEGFPEIEKDAEENSPFPGVTPDPDQAPPPGLERFLKQFG